MKTYYGNQKFILEAKFFFTKVCRLYEKDMRYEKIAYAFHMLAS